MKNFLLISLLLIALFSADAQPARTWNWAMGNNKGMRFPSGGPAVYQAGRQMTTLEGGGAVSDLSGNMLFYTDGQKVWDGNNFMRTDFTGITASTSSHQNGLAVPYPANPSQYIIFTVNMPSNHLYCHLYDPTTWSIVAGPIQLTTYAVSEGLAATVKANGTDYWVAIHEEQNPLYHIIDLTNTIVVGPAVNPPGSDQFWYWSRGSIKFSLDGTQLAIADPGAQKIEVFPFNNSTGSIEGITMSRATGGSTQGMEFSPDGSLIYALNGNDVMQYAIPSGAATTLCSGCGAMAGSMQLGPDCDIYYVRRTANYIGRIQNPDIQGVGCGNQSNYLSVANPYYGLPVSPSNYLASACGAVLPFEMIQFGAKVSNNEWVDVFWSTTSDKETDYYVVERSLNGKDFEKLDVVDGKMIEGNAHYDFIDPDLKVGKTYYRIRAVDLKGEYRYSKVTMINYEKIDIVSVFPNPVMHQLHMKYESDIEDLNVYIYNAIGEIVYTHELSMFDQGNVTVDVNQFPSGVYFISIKDFLTGYEVKQNFIKQ